MTETAQYRWRVVRFREVLATGVRNGIYKPVEYHGRGAKIVNMGELFAHPRLRAVPMRRIHVDGTELDRFGLNELDLLFARRSLVAEGAGKCSIVLEVNEPTVFESSIIRARPNGDEADSLFLYYFWSSPVGAHLLDTIRRQVAVSGITGKDLEQLQIRIPPVEDQRAIAAVLGALDNKIEQNRRTAHVLERLAQAIFRAWFVDFEPVKAKAAGAAAFPSMPQPVFDALPTHFVHSAIGPVPKGWGVGQLGDIAAQQRDGVDPADVEVETPYIGLEHMPRHCISLTEWGSAGQITSGKARFFAGQILFGKLRPYFHKVGVAPIDGVCSTDIVVIEPRDPLWLSVALGHTSSEKFVSHATACSTGTKMPRTNWRDMASFKIAVPPDAAAAALTGIVGPLLSLLIAGTFESRQLSAMRDYLLPKLLSGIVHVDPR